MSSVYSKQYHQVSDTLTNISLQDRFIFSKKLDVTTSVVSGYQTCTSTLLALKNLTYHYIQDQNLIALSLGDGLRGAGSTSNPIAIDVAWVNNQVVSNRLYPFSQVGDPATPLPIVIGANANLTVTSNILVYMNSNPATILAGNYQVTGTGIVSVYVRVWNGVASFVFSSTDSLPERILQTYIGTVTVASGVITQMNLSSVFRWNLSRPSAIPKGRSILVNGDNPWVQSSGVWKYAVGGSPIPDTTYRFTSLDSTIASGTSTYTGVIQGASNIKQDQTTTLTATLSPTASMQSVVWTTSDATIAVVDQLGNLTGVGSGTVMVTAVINGSVNAIFKCQVQPIKVTVQTSDTPKLGRLSQFAVTTDSSVATATTSWSTSDVTVATIDSNGLLVGVGLGTCVVTCIVNGRYRGTQSITVSANTATPISISGSTALTERYLGKTFNVFGSINLYDYFKTIFGRVPYVNEAIVLTVDSATAIIGNNVTTPALTIDNRFTSTNAITILNRGLIIGRGADVSSTFDVVQHTTQSTSGGDGLVNTSPISININNSGWIAGGGGAGGYGSGMELSDTSNISGGGGAPYGLGCHVFDSDSLQNATFSEAGPIAYINNYGATTAGNQSIFSGCGGGWGSRGLSGSNPLTGTWTVGSAPGYATKGLVNVVQNTGYIKGATS